jgi:predicted MPP superfamily phosphohydrolase
LDRRGAQLVEERSVVLDRLLSVGRRVCAGQATVVVIPGFGPPITLTSVPRAAAAGGLHVVNGRQLYVSRGIGLERGAAPRLRILCPPEVSLLTLRAAD